MTNVDFSMARRVGAGGPHGTPLLLAALVFLPSLVACLGRPDTPNLPAPLLTVASGSTVVEVERATGALRVLEGETPLAVLNGDACPPFRVALRPLDDDGAQYHDVEAPSDDLLWFVPGSPMVTPSNDALEMTWTMTSEATDDTFAVMAEVASGAEGFVEVDLLVDTNPRAIAMIELCVPIDPAAHHVGGGERFDGVDLTGRVIPLAFRAPGPYASGTNESHAPIPWIASTSRLGLLVETERVGAFDVGATDASKLFARFHGDRLPLRFRAGDILANVAAHNRRMGLPPMPPRWALAPQQWRNEHSLTLDGDTVVSDGRDRFLDDAATMRTLDLPNTTMWIDAPWATGYNTFTFNGLQFPDAPSMLERAEALGYRVIVWSTEHLNSSNDEDQQPGMPPNGSLGLFHAFSQTGLLVSTSGGDPFTFPWARGNGGFVDFSNPDAVVAWQDQVRPLLQMGVRGFKLDYGETMRADLLGTFDNEVPVFFDGATTKEHHTRYARLYHQAFLGVLDEVHPADHFIITRTGGIFDQQNGVAIWPGDLDNDFKRAGEPDPDEDDASAVGGLPAAISGALSLSMSGYPLYGSDIGGYRGGAPTTEVLLRWTQFGALSTIMQLGGGGTGDTTHNPWQQNLYDSDLAVPVYRTYAKLHMTLVPYIEALLTEATTVGTPPLIPLGVAVPDDEEAWADEEAYLFGPHLLVAPVVEAGAISRQVHLPAGDWLDWWTDAQHSGPTTVVVDAPLDRLPLFQRAGSTLPLADERLQTLVDAEDPDVVDPSTHPTRLVVRAIAGDNGSFTLADGTVITQQTYDRGMAVTVEGTVQRQILVVAVIREDDVGPWDAAPIRSGVPDTAAFPNLSDLDNCALPCSHRGDGRLYVLVDGPNASVAFGEDPTPGPAVDGGM